MKNIALLPIILIAIISASAYIMLPTVSFPSSFVQLSSSILSSSSTTSSAKNKVIYLFDTEIPDVNETKLGIPADLFTPSSIIVNKGDIVTVHFYNVEKDEPHTFTIGDPYNIDKNVPGGQNTTIVFKANYEGIFSYYCKYHTPTMQGQLVVIK